MPRPCAFSASCGGRAATRNAGTAPTAMPETIAVNAVIASAVPSTCTWCSSGTASVADDLSAAVST